MFYKRGTQIKKDENQEKSRRHLLVGMYEPRAMK